MDWKRLIETTRTQAARAPRWVWPAALTGTLAVFLLALLLHGSQAYGPLFEGLTPKQGGQVIDELQKLGIPYELNAVGSIIRVPESDLARARLQLAQMDLPSNTNSEAWQKLVKGSLTASDAAQAALSKRALEDTLERSVDGIRGVAQSRVTLALPKSTPFLTSQPHAKASVWIQTTAAGISNTQARAIAQMVANSVPGLDVSRVTVTDQNGDVLAPMASSGIGRAQQQLVFESQIEDRAASHVAALLAPLIGRDNFRVSAAASVNFSKVTQSGVTYGPKWMLAGVNDNERDRKGGPLSALGIAGALSNQPPGAVAAFLGNAGVKAAKRRARGGGRGTRKNAAGAKASSIPHSSSDNIRLQYDVDRTDTVTRTPSWRLNALSVSVVLNKHVVGLGSGLIKQVKAIVQNAISAPSLKVNVAVVPFGLENAAPMLTGWRAVLYNEALVHAAIEALAALLILFGVARPLARWLKQVLPALAIARLPQPAVATSTATPAQIAFNAQAHQEREQALERAKTYAQNKPQDVAEMLKRWIRDASQETTESRSQVPEEAHDS